MAKAKGKSKTATTVKCLTPEEELKARIELDTQSWVRTKADEEAVKAGYIFDASRGEYVCEWIETNCYLYEGGGFAGKPLKLMPYQREFVMRLFSWVIWSDEWDSYVRRFRKATLICAKKNGKTPFMAAMGLYLTMADGELGQKVYIAAKNGAQALQVQLHAVNMVDQSPNLKEPVCTVNRTTNMILHPQTRSQMKVLTGDNSRGAKAKEGINGSVFIDELHVFDREMAERVEGAGISRKEPINLAVSTAGDDPSSYGYERVVYGRDVNEWKKEDYQFLHVEYSVPPKTTDAELDADPVKFGKMANPAWGHIVKESEFRAYYIQNRSQPRAWNRTKQYRFNLWVGSTSPWLNESNWINNKRAFDFDDMAGRECTLGVDLSRTRDMTSVVWNFPSSEENEEEDEEFELIKIIPKFWLPEATAKKRNSLFPYLEWAELDAITLTDGTVVDYGAVEEEVLEICDSYGLVVTDIYFDQHYAEEFTQRLADRLGSNRVAVEQKIMTLSPLCKEMERRIDKGKLIHNGNPVMDWQIGHVQVVEDKNQNIRPVKPNPDSGKSIDGVMATVNTFAGIVSENGEEDNGPGVSFF